MPTNFLKLPNELRKRIYGLCLLHEESINPWTYKEEDIFAWIAQHQKLPSGLFRANKLIHLEAASLFYGQNHFDFTTANPVDTIEFLSTIGRNAGFIRRASINFPNVRNLEPGNVTIEESDSSLLAILQSSCANLSTLTTALDSTNEVALKLDALDHPKLITEALKLVNDRFRAIAPLQAIVVEVYENGPSEYIVREMKSNGWTVKEIEYIEEASSDGSVGDLRGYRADDDGWEDDYYDNDEYDIDNDSDFWRRAGD